MHAQVDHLVVTAMTLASGEDFVSQVLGVPLQPGGEHPTMGTHNLVLRLGDSVYLEVIAVNPLAPSPARARWFALDRMPSNALPRLATWVARGHEAHDRSPAATLGPYVDMSRGALRSRITIPHDGALACDGLLPSLIEWQTSVHPATLMNDSGCRFLKLEAFHPAPQFLREQLRNLDLGEVLQVSEVAKGDAPYLVAYIDTPGGVRRLGIEPRPANG